MQHRVMRDPMLEILHLGLAGQLAIDQKVTDLQEGRAGGQLIDRVAAIKKLSLVTVDIGDGTFARGGRGEAGIVGEHVALRVELSDIDDIRAQRGARHGKFERCVPEYEGCGACAVISHG